jgi:hypothetical protein
VSVDRYLDRQYEASSYNCAHFVCEVWEDMKGRAMAEVLSGFLCAPARRQTRVSDLRRIRFLGRPESPCIVLLQSPRQRPHVGIWIRGRVLHLPERGAAQFQTLDVVRVGFQSVRFFTC